MTLGKLFHFIVPQFPHLQHEGNDITSMNQWRKNTHLKSHLAYSKLHVAVAVIVVKIMAPVLTLSLRVLGELSMLGELRALGVPGVAMPSMGLECTSLLSFTVLSA